MGRDLFVADLFIADLFIADLFIADLFTHRMSRRDGEKEASPMTKSTVLTLASALLSSLALSAAAEPSPEVRDRALDLISQKHGLFRGYLAVEAAAEAVFPLSGGRAFEFKVLDESSGETFLVSLDGEGQELDRDRLAGAERAARAATYGTLDPALSDLLLDAGDEALVPVIIWLQEPAYDPPRRPAVGRGIPVNAQQAEDYLERIAERRGAAVRSRIDPLLRRLESRGIAVAASADAPALHGTLRQDEILRISRLPEVRQIYFAPLQSEESNVARITIGANTVNNRGIDGFQMRLAQIEVGGRVATNNPHLSGVSLNTTDVCAGASSHSTAVAGIIASTHSSRRGVAPAVDLFASGSCNGVTAQLQARANAAVYSQASAVNLSWGADTNRVPAANDLFFEDYIFNWARTVVKSAGNRGNIDGDVTSPGLGYNIITVGNFDDRNTTFRGDDIMNSTSSFGDPVSTRGDREKPELAAPGTNIETTRTSSPWTGNAGSGTSFAAPAVTGTVGLMVDRDLSLWFWPEAVKAILMTSAWNNIEGSSRLSEFDGAGGLRTDRADDLVRRLDGDWGGQDYDCGAASPLILDTIPLRAGRPTRAVIVWGNDSAHVDYPDEPGADLDLRIRNPSGSTVASSSSWDNTYEIVHFTPTQTGNHTLRVIRRRCDRSPRQIAWAWQAPNLLPNASFTRTPDTGPPPLWVNFNASGSSDPDGSISNYHWNFGDGTSGSGVSPLHTYWTNGFYWVVLTVTDNDGATDTFQNWIHVTDCQGVFCEEDRPAP